MERAPVSELLDGPDWVCVWLRPEAVAQIEFLEWTAGDRLRHSKFVGLREDKDPRSVVKEHSTKP